MILQSWDSIIALILHCPAILSIILAYCKIDSKLWKIYLWQLLTLEKTSKENFFNSLLGCHLLTCYSLFSGICTALVVSFGRSILADPVHSSGNKSDESHIQYYDSGTHAREFMLLFVNGWSMRNST